MDESFKERETFVKYAESKTEASHLDHHPPCVYTVIFNLSVGTSLHRGRPYFTYNRTEQQRKRSFTSSTYRKSRSESHYLIGRQSHTTSLILTTPVATSVTWKHQ